MPSLACNGVELYFETHGEGEPLLLIAGLASDSQSWGPVVANLARTHRVLLLDNRGAGRTRIKDQRIDIAGIADDGAALLDHLGHPRATIVGHSMGGFVAMELALRHPARVGRLVLAACASACSRRNSLLLGDWARDLDAAGDPASWFRALFYWIFSPAFFADERVLAEALRLALAYPYPQTAAQFRSQVEAIAAFDCGTRIAGLRVPVQVLAGANDILFPLAEVEALARALPQATLKVLSNAAHAIALESPVAFAAAVRDFAASA
jgi:pimeloyl-ACP methyl ester carboxylesterase